MPRCPSLCLQLCSVLCSSLYNVQLLSVQFKLYSAQWFWLCCITFADLEWASLAAWVTHSLRQPLLCKKASHIVKGDIIMKWKFR